jgi:hypothetical protein
MAIPRKEDHDRAMAQREWDARMGQYAAERVTISEEAFERLAQKISGGPDNTDCVGTSGNAFGKTPSILLQADALIHGDRARQYGNVKDNFGRWANLCNIMGIEVTAQELAMISVLGKLAREANKKKTDNIVDAAGYLGLYDELS